MVVVSKSMTCRTGPLPQIQMLTSPRHVVDGHDASRHGSRRFCPAEEFPKELLVDVTFPANDSAHGLEYTAFERVVNKKFELFDSNVCSLLMEALFQVQKHVWSYPDTFDCPPVTHCTFVLVGVSQTMPGIRVIPSRV